MTAREKSAQLLGEYLALKKSKSPHFSLRYLAKKLGISPSYLSKVFTGKKPLPLSRLTALAKELELDAYSLRALKRALAREQKELGLADELIPVEADLPSEEFEVSHDFFLIEDWYFLAILELATCQGFRPEWISPRLGLKEDVAAYAWNQLVNRGLVQEKNGAWEKTKKKIRLPSAKLDQRFQNHYVRMLRKAAEEVGKKTEADFARRLALGASVATNEESFLKAKKYLEDSLVEAGKILTSGKADRVYYLTFQLFPLTKN
jgi:uncharacterized protein (TIGR02147 family)